MARNLIKARPLLRKFFRDLKGAYERDNPRTELFITEVDRSPVRQLRLFCQGRDPKVAGPIVTWKDGFVNLSMHNTRPLSSAIDVGIRFGRRVIWTPSYFRKLGKYVHALGYGSRIRWGGAFGDNPHFEIR